MPKKGRRRRGKHAAECSNQSRTIRSSKTNISNTSMKENQPRESHLIKENENIEELSPQGIPHPEIPHQELEATSLHKNKTRRPNTGRKKADNKQFHLEERLELTGENQETLKINPAISKKKTIRCVSEPASRSHGRISDKIANFMKLCHFISSLANGAAIMWFKLKYPIWRLKEKQKKLKEVMYGFTRLSRDKNKFLLDSPEGILVVYDKLDITAIVQLSKKLSYDKKEIENKWIKEMQENDHSDVAELRRIHEIRNKIAHNNVGEVDETDFRNMWKALEKAISKLSRGKLNEHFSEYHVIPWNKSLPRVQMVIPTDIRYQHFQLIKKWMEDDKIFVETKYCSKAFDLLQSCGMLLIVGGKGMGKSALARHLALEMSKFHNYEIVPVLSFDQILAFRDMDVDQLFLLGNVFKSSLRYNQDILSLLSSGYGILQHLQRSKVIVTCKPNIFQKLSQHDIVDRKVIQSIDIEDPENTLSVEEKFNILQKHCKLFNVDKQLFAQLSLDSKIEMFPYLCEKFSKRKDCNILGQIFFDNPCYFLMEEFKILRDFKPLHFASLVLLLMQDDRKLTYQILAKEENNYKKKDIINCCVETNTVTDFSIMQALRCMNDDNEYVTELGENEYVFKHDNIAEVLAYCYGSLFPEQILKHMPSDYVCNSICLEDMVSDSDFAVKIARSLYFLLVRRFYLEISSRDPNKLFNIFNSRCLKCPEFLIAFISMLYEIPEEELNEIFVKDFETDSTELDVIGKILTYTKRTMNGDISAHLWEYGLLFGLHDDSNKEVIKIRVISWIVYYGHEAILKCLLERKKTTWMRLVKVSAYLQNCESIFLKYSLNKSCRVFCFFP